METFHHNRPAQTVGDPLWLHQIATPRAVRQASLIHRTGKGVFAIDFHRNAVSLEATVNSAIKNVKAAGHDVDVEHVQIEAGTLQQPA